MAKFKSSASPASPTRKPAAPKKAASKTASASRKKPAAAAAPDMAARGIMDSAQQIWQTGVKALGRAQQEGTRLFEALVKEGAGVEKKTRSLAAGKVNAVRDSVRDSVENRVGQVKDRATDTWDRLEKVFEERVQRALTRLGVPGREELQTLIGRVDELNARLRELAAKPAAPASKAAAQPAPVATKPAASKKAAEKKPAVAKPKPAAAKKVAKAESKAPATTTEPGTE